MTGVYTFACFCVCVQVQNVAKRQVFVIVFVHMCSKQDAHTCMCVPVCVLCIMKIKCMLTFQLLKG